MIKIQNNQNNCENTFICNREIRVRQNREGDISRVCREFSFVFFCDFKI